MTYVSCCVCGLSWLPAGGTECPVCRLRKQLVAEAKLNAWAQAPLLVAIKEGWEGAGRLGYAVGPDVMVSGQEWTPVLWNGEEDPDWHKSAGLEKKR